MQSTRLSIGTGVDVHAIGERPGLYLAGLFWPRERELLGHSDGDVAVHAACDALLMAAGYADLGQTFGVDKPEHAGASGAYFLRETNALLAQESVKLLSLSINIICNAPRFAPRRLEAQDWFRNILEAPVQLNATTTDGLGLTGRGEGIAALATALVELPSA